MKSWLRLVWTKKGRPPNDPPPRSPEHRSNNLVTGMGPLPCPGDWSRSPAIGGVGMTWLVVWLIAAVLVTGLYLCCCPVGAASDGGE